MTSEVSRICVKDRSTSRHHAQSSGIWTACHGRTAEGQCGTIAGVPTAYVFGSRGCLSQCDYCCVTKLHSFAPGPGFRQRDPEWIADEMESLYRNRGIRQFVFHDDNFLVPSEAKNLKRINVLDEAFTERRLDDIALYIK